MDAKQIMLNTVALTCDGLSDIELMVLHNVALSDQNPHGRVFDYDRVKPLFNIEGERMHEETKIALTAIVQQRGIEFLRSIVGMFDSGETDTSENAKAIVSDFILKKHDKRYDER